MAMTLLQLKTTFPDPLRQGLVDLMFREMPGLFERLNFINHTGLAYPYNAETALPGVAWRALNEEFSATGEGMIVPMVEPLSIVGGDINTDSLIIAQKGLGPARANRTAKKIKAGTRLFLKSLFKGSRATNAKSMDGLERRITAGQTVTNATNGATPSWEKFVELQDKVEGDNASKILCMNMTTRRLLSADVASDAGGKGVFDVGGQLKTFNDSPIVIVGRDEADAEILPFTEACGNSNVCASAYCLRLGSDVDEEYFQGISGIPGLFQTIDVGYTGAMYKDVVQAALGIGTFSGFCAARLKGLKAE